MFIADFSYSLYEACIMLQDQDEQKSYSDEVTFLLISSAVNVTEQQKHRRNEKTLATEIQDGKQ